MEGIWSTLLSPNAPEIDQVQSRRREASYLYSPEGTVSDSLNVV